MMRRLTTGLRRFAANISGATASVEFALIVTPMAIMLIGTLEVSRLFFARNSLQYATEEAGRYAMTHVTATDVTLENYALDAFGGTGNDGNAPVFDAVIDTAADPDTVTISGTMTYYLDIVLIEFDIPLEGESTVPLID